ncbi:cytochrome P450 [Lentithecium fluviatile CBS 122367]|uniref:Cytochrome P450 n=1 Tax=Lentithecium fluviatile CBS 122367 TaxID=1168545 RepID=A0A6G1IR90_9PLEO|nr:cytochrome P450 [Lentithecium fluviatile CBS 122367]
MDSESHHRSVLPSVAALAAVAYLLYGIGLVVYRLYLHPLAKFPGPRLAAATYWYEAYYELVKTGKFSNKISELHDQYGPIVRVTPYELHIRDSRALDTVYPAGVYLDKERWDRSFGSGGVLQTVHASVHKRRRAALNPMCHALQFNKSPGHVFADGTQNSRWNRHVVRRTGRTMQVLQECALTVSRFSKRSIMEVIHIVHQHIDEFTDRMLEYEARKEPLNVTWAFPALTGDIIMDYFFGFNYGSTKHPEFQSFHAAFKALGLAGHVAMQFPWFLPMMDYIPPGFAEWLQPALKPLLDLKRDLHNLVYRTLNGEDLKTNDAKRTIFQEILSSKLPDSEKSQKRLEEEANIVVAGGVETTAFALDIAVYHITNTPHIYQRLHADLVAAFPNRSKLDLQTLEQMPYLRACAMEALRLSYGISARNPRTHDKAIQYREWVIPARTNISMSIPDVHHDESIFPHSTKYIPERWLGDAKTPDGVSLEKFMISFGRGTRSCPGMNLAWTELHLIMGMMFRRFKFELYEPDINDVLMEHDFFVPRQRADCKGVRVIIESTVD